MFQIRRSEFKRIAAVVFVIVIITIHHFYFYPLKNGAIFKAYMAHIPSSLSISSSPQMTEIYLKSAAPTRHPVSSSDLRRQPQENSVFHSQNRSSPTTPNKDEDQAGSTISPTPPQQELQLNSSYQAYSDVNLSTSGSSSMSVHYLQPETNSARPLNQSNITTVESGVPLAASLFPLCPKISPHLKGAVKVKLQAPSMADIDAQNEELAMGGHYTPTSCEARSRVAILVPFMNREHQLPVLLYNLLPILKRQQVEFKIFVIEQVNSSINESFNKGMLYNAGFLEANKIYLYWQCYIFQDVDLLPENDHNTYDCPVQPRHMAVGMNKFKYKLIYNYFFGGVTAMTKEHYLKVNGYSNMFWGWGAEDDDMAYRISFHGLNITRPSPFIGRYTMLKHPQQKMNKHVKKLMALKKHRVYSDGLSNLAYKLEQIYLKKTYTLIRIKVVVGGRDAVVKT